MKKLLFLFIIYSSILFAKDSFKFSKLGIDYGYYGFPFFINIGYYNQNNSLYTLAPYIGLSLCESYYSVSLFANVGIEVRYKRYYFSLKYKQGVTPDFAAFNYKYLEYYGIFETGYYFNNVSLSYDINFGQMLNSKNYINNRNSPLEIIFQVSQNINIKASIYNDGINVLSFNSKLNVNIIPYSKQYSYEISINIPYTFNHKIGELAFMPALKYSSFFEGSQKKYNIGAKYLSSLGMFDITGNDNNFYEFLSYIHIEYRLFLFSLEAPANRVYFMVFGNVGIGKKINKNIYEANLLYMFGGGIGYNLFDAAPFQLAFGVDQNMDFIFNISFISPIFQKP